MTTTLATAVASFSWAGLEWLLRGKPSVLGFVRRGRRACGSSPRRVDSRCQRGRYHRCAGGRGPVFRLHELKSWFHYATPSIRSVHAVGGDPGRISHRAAGDCGRKSKSFRHLRSAKRARTNCRALALAGATESDWNYHRAGVGRDVVDWFDCARDDRIADHTGNRASGSISPAAKAILFRESIRARALHTSEVEGYIVSRDDGSDVRFERERLG